MTTLTYGLKRPQTRDTGSALFTALEDNITQLDGHTHNGTNSALLSTAAVAMVTQTIAAGSFVDQGGGRYRQTITLPGALTLSVCTVMFKTSLGHLVQLTMELVSSTSYYVYTNDNSASYTAMYIS